MKPSEKEDPAIEAARRAGFDIDLLDSNLALTVAQHDNALEFALALEEARIARDAGIQTAARPTH